MVAAIISSYASLLFIIISSLLISLKTRKVDKRDCMSEYCIYSDYHSEHCPHCPNCKRVRFYLFLFYPLLPHPHLNPFSTMIRIIQKQ
jgi:hypothetical protein